jgi:sugar phosphate isomerase/epimerase
MAIACSTSVFCNSTIEAAFQGAHELGFKVIDLLTIDGWVHVNTTAMVNDFEAAVARVDDLLQQYDLKLLAVNCGISPLLHDRSDEACARRDAETRALIRFMQHYGVTIAAVQPRTPDRNRSYDSVLNDSAQTMRDMLSIAQGSGIRFAFECHVNSVVETMDQAQQLMRLVPDLDFVYDPTHFVMQGFAPAATLPLMEKAIHVHLRDAGPEKMQTAYGEGTVDFDWILTQLKERNYTGDFSIEYLERPEMDIRDDVIAVRDKIAEYFPE